MKNLIFLLQIFCIRFQNLNYAAPGFDYIEIIPKISLEAKDKLLSFVEVVKNDMY